MGRRITSTTKGGKFMNPTDQARKEARRRELRKNKKQRLMVRQAVIKTKDPRQMLAELDTLDEMELNPSENLPYNDKVVKEKRIKLLENIDRITQYYIKEDPEHGLELKRLVDTYRKDRIKKEVYYESVKNAQRVKIETIPLPDAPFETPQLSDIPLPGLQPPSILKKPPMLNANAIVKSKKTPPGPPPGPPPAKKKYKGHDPTLTHPHPPPGLPPTVSNSDDEVDDAYDPGDDLARLEGGSDDERSDEEFFHRDDDADEPKNKKRNTSHDDEDDDVDDEAHYEARKRAKMDEIAGEASGITPLQAMMLKLAGQEVPKQRSDGADADGRKARKVAFADSQQKPPPGPPPGLPPGPPSLPPDIATRHMHPGMLPPGPPPGHPPTLPPGPPPGLPPNMPMRMNLPPGMHQPSNKSSSERYGASSHADGSGSSLHGSGVSNILSAPPSLISRRQEDMPTMIVAKPQIISNPKADVTRFMPTSLRVKRQEKVKIGPQKPASGSSKPSSEKYRHEKSKKSKVNADAAYDSFMKEMQGFL